MVTYYVARSADQGAVPHMREYEVTRFSFLFGCDGGATSSLGAWCMSDGRAPPVRVLRVHWTGRLPAAQQLASSPLSLSGVRDCIVSLRTSNNARLSSLSIYISFWEIMQVFLNYSVSVRRARFSIWRAMRSGFASSWKAA